MTLEQRKQAVKKMIDDADEDSFANFEELVNLKGHLFVLTEEQIAEIDKGIEEAKNNQFVSKEVVQQKFGSWLIL
ncbi:MAG: hypothetical protein H6553_05135 [Chitinophagales bacterium]|nr:hypothetical protein [Chitinophagales bacterium]